MGRYPEDPEVSESSVLCWVLLLHCTPICTPTISLGLGTPELTSTMHLTQLALRSSPIKPRLLYKVALGNCFEEEEWGPTEWCILAKHFECQGKSPYAYHAIP